MTTIALIDPSPTARAVLAAGLRSEFTVLENGTLIPSLATADTKLIVVSASAVSPGTLSERPFAALPCLVLGSFPVASMARRAPLVVIDSPVDSEELLVQVRTLLNTGHGFVAAPPGDGPPKLRPPYQAVELIAWVQRAARAHAAQVPLLITGEHGTGKRTVARAIHRVARHGTLLRVTPLTARGLTDGRMRGLLASSEAPVTLIADSIDAFSGEAQSVLAECIAAGNLGPAGSGRRLWLVATTTADLAALTDAGRFDRELASRLAEIAIELAPLRSRPGDIPSIARDVLGELAALLRSPLTLTQEGAASLEHHPWAGNLSELLAVLRRTAVLSTEGLIGPEQILFDTREFRLSTAPVSAAGKDVLRNFMGIEASPAKPTVSCACETARYPSPVVPQQLELILTELAHELKNPMVTIKTFAQHLPTLLEDTELRQRFSVLTDDAISRMDSLLENLLEFARLGHPNPEPLALTPVLDGTLVGVSEKIEQRGARIRREGWERAPRVVADEGHLSYALRNLFDSLASELPRHHELAVHVRDNGTIALRFVGSGGVTAKLQSFLCEGPGVPGPAALPLRFTLARAVIARNGGQIAVDSGDGGETLVTVALPPCPGGASARAEGPGAAPQTGG